MNCRTCKNRRYDYCITCARVLDLHRKKEEQLTFWNGRSQLKGGDGSRIKYVIEHQKSIATCR